MDKTQLDKIISESFPQKDDSIIWEASDSPSGNTITITAKKHITIGELPAIEVEVSSIVDNNETQIIFCVQSLNNEVLSKI